MRVLVAGAGAIGSAVGGSLAMAGHRVALLGRADVVARARGGELVVAWPRRRERLPQVLADTEVDPLVGAMGGLDLAIVTTKVYDTEGVCRALRVAVREHGALVLVLQNGVGGDEVAAEILGDAPVVAGAITWIVSTVAPGEYAVQSRRRGLGLAPHTSTRQQVHALTRVFRGAGIRCRAYRDARAMRWSKLLLNILGNAVPAVLDLSPAEAFADERLYALERAAFLEAVAVMRAGAIRAVNLPGYPVRGLVTVMERLPEGHSRLLMAHLIAGGRAGKAPSLQIDARRGRPHSEVTALNGAVAREGERLGVPTPANAAICEALLGILSGAVPRDGLRRNPEALIAWAKERGWRGR